MQSKLPMHLSPRVRGANPQRDTMQVTSNAKRPVPDAWRSITGGSKG